MTISNLIKTTFKTVVENPSITLFLVLFLILTNFFTSYILTSAVQAVKLVLSACLFLLVAVFLSGWFQVAKEMSGEKERKNLFPVFLEGIGKNIISVIISILVYVFLFVVFALLAKEIALALFGKLEFLANAPTTQNGTDIIEYINKLSINEQSAIYGWYFCFITTMSLLNFFMLFYFPAMFFIENQNIVLKPFIALKDSVVFIFKHFFGALFLSILINITYFALALLSAIFAKNAIISILVLFAYIYFVSYSIMLIFNYYEAKAISNHRTDSVGEDKVID